MAWKSNGVFARRSASRRRQGRLMLELAVVKITSLIFGIGISFAVDPEIAGLDERLVAAIEVEHRKEGEDPRVVVGTVVHEKQEAAA